MKLPEFITFCTLKGLIVLHERLDNEWVADKVNKQKLVIENNDFLATITYTHFTGEYNILATQLSEVTTYRDEPLDKADLGTIISKFV